jgi:hypothetical protein
MRFYPFDTLTISQLLVRTVHGSSDEPKTCQNSVAIGLHGWSRVPNQESPAFSQLVLSILLQNEGSGSRPNHRWASNGVVGGESQGCSPLRFDWAYLGARNNCNGPRKATSSSLSGALDTPPSLPSYFKEKRSLRSWKSSGDAYSRREQWI